MHATTATAGKRGSVVKQLNDMTRAENPESGFDAANDPLVTEAIAWFVRMRSVDSSPAPASPQGPHLNLS